MSHPTLEDRIIGCLLAGALGDAVGAPFEGKPPTSKCAFPESLQVTDDTQLTIATCESIIEFLSVKPEAVAERFRRWFLDRRLTGLGSSTLKSLMELSAGGHWAAVGALGERAAGNGAAMRVAPLAFALNPGVASERQTIRDVCRITHRNEEAYIGALAIIIAIRHALDGEAVDNQLITILTEKLPDSRVRDRLIDIRDSSISVEEYAARFGTSGYVVDSVPIAILAAVRSEGLLPTFDQIIRCGGDTDTIASMFGQVFGAVSGTSALPLEIVDRIDGISVIRDTFAEFSQVAISLG